MVDLNAQRDEREVCKCNGQTSVEIAPRPGSLYCCLFVAAFVKHFVTVRFRHATRWVIKTVTDDEYDKWLCKC